MDMYLLKLCWVMVLVQVLVFPVACLIRKMLMEHLEKSNTFCSTSLEKGSLTNYEFVLYYTMIMIWSTLNREYLRTNSIRYMSFTNKNDVYHITTLTGS